MGKVDGGGEVVWWVLRRDGWGRRGMVRRV